MGAAMLLRDVGGEGSHPLVGRGEKVGHEAEEHEPEDPAIKAHGYHLLSPSEAASTMDQAKTPAQEFRRSFHFGATGRIIAYSITSEVTQCFCCVFCGGDCDMVIPCKYL